jgi:rfaE bifunctional protein nucleotidyltransferase chain/domain
VNDKIISLEELDLGWGLLNVTGENVLVFTTGVFDIPHVGHPRYLEAAKKLGDILIVGVHSDELVKRRKGPDRPIYPVAERAELLSYYQCVDFILILEDQDKIYETIRKMRPDILVVSETTTDDENCPRTMKHLFDDIVYVKVLGAQSEQHSTDFIKAVQERFQKASNFGDDFFEVRSALTS